MSRSPDRPGGPYAPVPPPSAPRSRERDGPYSQPVTGPSGHAAPPGYRAPSDQGLRHEPAGPRSSETEYSEPPRTARTFGDDNQFDPELRAEAQPNGTRRGRGRAGSASIVPAGSVTSKSLTLVVAIMCFLACLTAGGVYMVNQSASAWLRDIASEVTLQIEPRERVDIDRAVLEATAFLSRQPGIRAVKPLSRDESAALVEPWLGSSDALKALPIPRLIAIEVDRTNPPDLDALRALVATELKDATLDDHRHWQQQIRTVTRSLALGGLAILILVGAATMLIIVSATRSSMASNREIVEVLHLVGATDSYIAHEFERHFLSLGIRAGLVGAGLAALVFLVMPSAMQLMGGSVVTVAEMRRLFGTGILDLSGYGVLAAVVVVTSALCMVTSRYSVYGILDTQR